MDNNVTTLSHASRDIAPLETDRCWVCASARLILYKRSDVQTGLSSRSFAITDSDYGRTGELYRCQDCSFIQCTDIRNALSFYEQLEDKEYEDGRTERALQATKLLALVSQAKAHGRLVDIGAGSGILVEQAAALGYKAEGVEPSNWLRGQAIKRGLTVHLGVFPHPNVATDIDLVTLVDVIEHISEPVALLRSIRSYMADDGVGLVVTPDVSSVTARLLGKHWWHFRFAHIGYFDKKTLLLALARAGLEPIRVGRPSWYFAADYLLHRVNQYLPNFLRLPVAKFWGRFIIPLNLRDSLYVVFRKTPGYRNHEQ